jgi:hypothetical protein
MDTWTGRTDVGGDTDGCGRAYDSDARTDSSGQVELERVFVQESGLGEAHDRGACSYCTIRCVFLVPLSEMTVLKDNERQGIGINATEHLEQARQRAAERGWDERIPFLTDENYELLVKNETFATPEEAEKRVWFAVV